MMIDGHALLFIFVPVLLFTDSLSVDAGSLLRNLN